ncbi:hypothetical protein Tco_1028841 [Tanacetum coccineum]|uniref:Uncharacterized protein n=1 Tax=Tanacetum coccineum TaxID=301880 RepID=A0ABQ5G358_9ASTR
MFVPNCSHEVLLGLKQWTNISEQVPNNLLRKAINSNISEQVPNGVDCFPKQVIWDLLRDIGYEGNLAQLTFSKPLFSPQWKYLVHVLLHCLSPKSTSWEQFGTNIASALVGLATNQKFNFSLMILTGMLGHISNRAIVFEQAVRGSRQTSGLYTIRFTSFHGTATPHDSDAVQGTDTLQGTAAYQGTASIPKSPNDYTPTDASQTSGGDEGLLDVPTTSR